jgi:hypothetical protein
MLARVLASLCAGPTRSNGHGNCAICPVGASQKQLKKEQINKIANMGRGSAEQRVSGVARDLALALCLP